MVMACRSFETLRLTRAFAGKPPSTPSGTQALLNWAYVTAGFNVRTNTARSIRHFYEGCTALMVIKSDVR